MGCLAHRSYLRQPSLRLHGGSGFIMNAPFNLPPQPSGWPVIGHDNAVAPLRRSLRTNQLSHAYLLTGPSRVGKRTLALTFAMAVNCESFSGDGGEFPDAPCLLCRSCSLIAHGTHPDVVEVNLHTQAAALGETGGKSRPAMSREIKIDTIREMQATV